MVQNEYRDMCETYLMRNFSRDILITRGKGARVWDDEGNEYIDCVAGIAVCSPATVTQRLLMPSAARQKSLSISQTSSTSPARHN